MLDIDECTEETDDCDQVCSNTEGSYTCDCNNGYKLGIDGKTCSRKLSPPNAQDNVNHYVYIIAVCADACGHCIECVDPGTCTCNDGWTGSDCCQGNINVHVHMCVCMFTCIPYCRY